MPANISAQLGRLGVVALLLGGALTAQAGAAPAPAQSSTDLQRMSEQLDQLDKLDLDDALEKAAACIRSDRFDCAEGEIKKARKSANSGADRKRIQAMEVALADRREALAQEQRRREEEEARRAEDERAARQARRNQESDDSSSHADNRPSMDFSNTGRQLIDMHNRFVASLQASRNQATNRAPAPTPSRPSNLAPVPKPSMPRAESRAPVTPYVAPRPDAQQQLARSVQQDFERRQAERRAPATSSQPEPSAPTQVAARSEPSRGAGAQASEPRSGTLYFMVQARVRSNLVSRKSDAANVYLKEDGVIPVEWTWAKSGPVFMDEVVRAARRDVLERFGAHVERDFRRCRPDHAGGECWAIDLYADHGTTPADAHAKHDQTARQVDGTPDKRDAGFSYRANITVR